MELGPGFKLSEAGPIPDDWEAVPIGDVLERTALGGNYANGPEITSWPLIKMGNLERGEIRVGELDYVRSHTRPDQSHRLRRGDVLLNTRNTLDLVGKVAIWNDQLSEAYYNSNLLRLDFRADRVPSRRFANFRMNHPATLHAIKSLATGTTSVGAIYTRDLLGLYLALPSPSEQRAIAATLADLDQWITSVEAEAEKLASMKAAAMDALLTPATRLPGFSGEWLHVRLGDRGTFRKGRGITRAEVLTTGLPAVRYGELYTRFNAHIRQFYSFISAESAASALRLQFGDICFAASGETAEEIGKCAAVLHKGPCFAGGDIIALTPEYDDPAFLGYLLNTAELAEQKTKLGQGDAVVHIHADKLADLELELPDLAEQQAIATVLSDIDAALSAARAVVAKARSVKAAAMDALLSGRVRLPGFGPTARRASADAQEAA